MDEEGRFDAGEAMILARFLSGSKEKMCSEATDAYEAVFYHVISLDKQ